MLKSLKASRMTGGLLLAALVGTSVPAVTAQRRVDVGEKKRSAVSEAPEGTTSFVPGNLVVCRSGDGAAALTGNATAVFLDEFTPAGALVRSVPVPNVAAGARLTITGNATTECEITRSVNQQFLIIPGYDAVVGTATPNTQAAATVPRVIGRVSSTTSFDLTTTTTSFSAGNIRSAASTDGVNLWAVGSNTGVVFTTLGSVATAGTLVSNTLTNTRTVGIFGGQLFTSSGSGTLRMNTVGTGLPTTTGNTTTALPGLPTATNSLNGFFFADLSPAIAGYDTLYVADDQNVGAGAILKFTSNGTTWTQTGAATGNAQYRGLTGTVSGGVVTLYATRGGTELVSVVDATGYNGTLAAAPTLLSTAPNNTAYRGVAMAPQATTAAGVTVSGRVTTSDGRGITNALVTISGGALQSPITVYSGRLGQFSFADIPAGQSYLVSVSARRFSFDSSGQVVVVNDNVGGVNFVASGRTDRR